MTGSIPYVNHSILALSPCLMESLVLGITLPEMLLTITIDTLSLYRLLALRMASLHKPFFSSTSCTHGITIQSKAATRSVSRMPRDLPAALMASLASANTWCIFLSSPATSWRWDTVWVITFLNLSASIPVIVLKSTFKREIFLLSLGFNDLTFLGFAPNTIKDVLCEGLGCFLWKTACTTSVSGNK